MKTIAQQIKWDFETNGNLEIRDKGGNLIYYERSDKSWGKYERDSEGNETYYIDSRAYWERREWDSKGNRLVYQDSNGVIEDNRPKPCEGKIVEFGGEKFKLVKV